MAKNDLQDKALSVLEKAKKGGKIRIGVNEVTKAVERGIAKLVLAAEDVQPKEIIMHLPAICKEKNIPFASIATKKELGEKAGIQVGAAAVAVIEEGEGKKELEEIVRKSKE